MYSKVIQLYIYPSFFRFFPHIVYYRKLGREEFVVYLKFKCNFASYTLSGSPHLMEWGCTVFTLDLEPKFSLRNKKGFVVLACSFHMLELCFQPSLLHGAPSAAESTASLRPDPGVPPLVTFSLSSRQGDLAPFYLFLWFHYILKLFFK